MRRRQQGGLKGYNPRKHGRPSHHPLLAILAEAKVVLHAWLRSGNTASARGVIAFLAETLAKLPDGFRLYALRADSGFFVTEFLVELERRTLPYAIAVRMNPHLRRTVAGIKQWTPFAHGLEASETSYQAYGWQTPRRVVVVREVLRERPQARGRKLREVPGYTFSCSGHHPRPRSGADLALLQQPRRERKPHQGTQGRLWRRRLLSPFLRWHRSRLPSDLLLFNLLAEFKHEVTQDEAPRLMTLRTRLLVIGAIRGADGRQQILRLGLRGHWRRRFAALLQRIAALAVSTVAQFTNDQKNPPPKPLETASAPLPTKLTSCVQMMFLGLTKCFLRGFAAKSRKSYRLTSVDYLIECSPESTPQAGSNSESGASSLMQISTLPS